MADQQQQPKDQQPPAAERQVRMGQSYADEHRSYRGGKTYFVNAERADFLIGHGLAVDVAPAPSPTPPAPSNANQPNGNAAPTQRAARQGR